MSASCHDHSSSQYPEGVRIRLEALTSENWMKAVESDLPSFLRDHAACERKASATGINFVVQYPDRTDLIDPMIRLAREELLHFQRVCKILQEKGIALGSDEKDPYIQELLKLIRHGRDERLLDRLLVFGIVEARGTERFRLLGQKLQDLKLRSFYAELADAEERHHELFTKLALKYFPEPLVSSRIKELVACESEIVRRLPLRAAVH